MFPDKNNWTKEDYDCLIDASVSGAFHPEHWLAMCCNESGLANNPPAAGKPGTGKYAYNKDGGARGLFQAMPSTLKNLGWLPGTPDYLAAVDANGRAGDFRNASCSTQIQYSLKYLDGWRTRFKLKSWDRVGDLYLCNFMPAYLRYKDDASYVIADKIRNPLIYRVNAGLDHGQKGFINVADMQYAASKHVGSAVYNVAIESLTEVFRLRGVLFFDASKGLAVNIMQHMLNKLGFGPLAEDNNAGPLTAAALEAFQNANGVTASGRLDNDTRNALFEAFKKLGFNLPTF